MTSRRYNNNNRRLSLVVRASYALTVTLNRIEKETEEKLERRLREYNAFLEHKKRINAQGNRQRNINLINGPLIPFVTCPYTSTGVTVDESTRPFQSSEKDADANSSHQEDRKSSHQVDADSIEIKDGTREDIFDLTEEKKYDECQDKSESVIKVTRFQRVRRSLKLLKTRIARAMKPLTSCFHLKSTHTLD